MLEVTNISASSFSAFFKNAYKMPFKEYLLNIRVGYACKLLTENKYNISEVAFQSGFENISNFNRQFKKIKGITPSQFLNQVNSMET
jgi:AraC-like DNA-binding protein